jgi:hypothetical protein
MDQKSFNKLSLDARRTLLKKGGNFLATRQYRAHTVHLYDLNGSYIEVWNRVGFDCIEWIEFTNNKETINSYLKKINLEEDLNI